jgi:hypothetical protein
MYIYIYMYVYIYTHIYTYTYIYTSHVHWLQAKNFMFVDDINLDAQSPHTHRHTHIDKS